MNIFKKKAEGFPSAAWQKPSLASCRCPGQSPALQKGFQKHFLSLAGPPPGHQGEVPAGGVAGHLRGQLGGLHALLVLLGAVPRPRLPDDHRECQHSPGAPAWGAGLRGAVGAPSPASQAPKLGGGALPGTVPAITSLEQEG